MSAKSKFNVAKLRKRLMEFDDIKRFQPQSKQAKIMEKICEKLPNPLPRPIDIMDKFGGELADKYNDAVQSFEDIKQETRTDPDYACLQDISTAYEYNEEDKVTKNGLKSMIKWLQCAVNGELPPRKPRGQTIKARVTVKPSDTSIQCVMNKPQLYYVNEYKNGSKRKQLLSSSSIKASKHANELLKKIQGKVKHCEQQFLKDNPYHLCYKLKIPIQDMMNQLTEPEIQNCKDQAVDQSIIDINRLQQRYHGYVTPYTDDYESKEAKIVDKIISRHIQRCLLRKYCKKHGRKFTQTQFNKLVHDIKRIYKRVLERNVPSSITSMELRKRPLTFKMWKTLETRHQELTVNKAKMKKDIKSLKTQLRALRGKRKSKTLEKVMKSQKTSKANLTKLKRYLKKYQSK